MRTILWCAAAALLLGAGAARAQVEQVPGTADTIIPIGDTAWSATARTDLMVTARVRMGPEISLDHNGSNSQFGLQTLIGVAYNMR